MEKEQLEKKIIALQIKIDNNINKVWGLLKKYKGGPGEQAVEDCIQVIFPGKKDDFCPKCCYSFNGVLDMACDLVTCERFPKE